MGTHRSLLDHLGVLTLETLDPGTTKLSWRLRARLRGRGLLSARLLSGDRLAARLLDQGLRSIKIALESSVRRARETTGDLPRADAHLPAEAARPIPIHGAQQPDRGRKEAPPRDSSPRGPAEPTL